MSARFPLDLVARHQRSCWQELGAFHDLRQLAAWHAGSQQPLYVGRLVWNRQQFVKDPNTGWRQARPNPETKWIIEDTQPALFAPRSCDPLLEAYPLAGTVSKMR
jgi:hypothetical protein